MSAEAEKVIAVYPTESTVRVGWFKRAPAFLVVHSTGRVSVNYEVEPGVIIEARSVQVSRVLSDAAAAGAVPLTEADQEFVDAMLAWLEANPQA